MLFFLLGNLKISFKLLKNSLHNITAIKYYITAINIKSHLPMTWKILLSNHNHAVVIYNSIDTVTAILPNDSFEIISS